MDPISIGIAVGISLISQTSQKLIAKATDPEIVAKSINWIFSAVDHFLKVRKQERAKDTPISPPPSPAQMNVPLGNMSDAMIEDKADAAKEIINSANQAAQTPAENGIKLEALDQFTIEQLSSEVESLLSQLETYLGNLRFLEEQASQFGGVKLAPVNVMNSIRIQQEEIAKRLVRLNRCMQKAYDTSAPNLETLAEVTKTL